MKTDTETLIADLRKLDQRVNRGKIKCLTMQQAADRLEELEDALHDLLTASDPLFSYGLIELHTARAKARKALGMD
jgi:hypothetical protein